MTSSNEISHAAETLRNGGLVAFPTETVYGLGADATNDLAVAKVYEAKGRPSFNPLITHVPDLAAAQALGRFDERALKLADAFWPGPLTLVVPRTDECNVSRLASAGLPTIAIRIPSHEIALELLRKLGLPVVAPSANPSGRVSPTSAEHVRAHLGNKIDALIDGGQCVVGLESTVIHVTTQPELLRAGGIPRDAIEKILDQPLVISSHQSERHAPGMLASHYAPRAAIRLNALQPNPAEAYLGFGDHQHGSHSLSLRGDLTEAAANLFRLLHEIDATNPSSIAIAPIPNLGLGEAINDRLQRAAAPRT
jgi:L-threonylcarbamoyladenylate synthase